MAGGNLRPVVIRGRLGGISPFAFLVLVLPLACRRLCLVSRRLCVVWSCVFMSSSCLGLALSAVRLSSSSCLCLVFVCLFVSLSCFFRSESVFRLVLVSACFLASRLVLSCCVSCLVFVLCCLVLPLSLSLFCLICFVLSFCCVALRVCRLGWICQLIFGRLGSSWGSMLAILGRLGGLLEPFWGVFWPSWAVLGGLGVILRP